MQTNKSENNIKRREIYFVFLDPAFGREIGGYKTRPVVVISVEDVHQDTRIVSVVPGTSTGVKKRNIVEVHPSNENKLRNVTYFQCHQARAIDQGRMTSRAIGMLSREDMERIEDAVKSSLGLL